MGEAIATVGDLAGMCGHDGTNWEKVLIDASKRLVVAVASAVAQDAQLHGYYDGDWQKAPIPLGISDEIHFAGYEGDAAAGYNLLQSSAVPAGEIHYVTHCVGLNTISAFGPIAFKLRRGGTDYQFYRTPNVPANYTITPPRDLIMMPGDYMKVEFLGCTLHDVLFFTMLGYRIDVDL